MLGFHLFGTSGEFDLPEPVTVRLLCHALLQRLPDEALPEAVESLTGMYEFYARPRLPLPELPARPSVSARITGSYVAPVYPVTED